MKKITSIQITKLFGTFDYAIDFEKNDGFTILTAPNGFGKSTILKIIRAATNGNFCYFAGLAFERIVMSFKGTWGDEWRPRVGPGSEPLPDEEAAKPKDTLLIIAKAPREALPAVEEDENMENVAPLEEDGVKPYVCTISVDDYEVSFTDEDISRSVNEVVAAIPTLEPMFQYTGVSGECRLWKDKRDGEVLDLSGVFRRYAFQFRKLFPWILPLVRRLNFAVNYISTNRLYNEEDDRPVTGLASRARSRRMEEGQEIQNPHLLKIFSISDDIRSANSRCMREQLQKARNLESNFVERVVASLNEGKRIPADDLRKRINNKITAIRRLENGCNEFGITSGNKMNKIPETNDDSALMVFDMYLDDVKEKLVVFDPLIKKLKIFSASLKSLLDLKEVKINLSTNSWLSGDSVLDVRNRAGTNIPLEALSSGEQHLIVLLGRLLFNTENPDALVMMDEPEISFHPSWQEDFSEILFKIQNELKEGKNGKRQFIIATHSPAFIGTHWDKTVELANMVKDR